MGALGSDTLTYAIDAAAEMPDGVDGLEEGIRCRGRFFWRKWDKLNTGGVDGMKRIAAIIGFTVLLGFLLAGGAKEAFAPTPASIERFDVGKGAVVARVASSPELQEEASRLLQSLGGSLGIIRADPKDGTVLRIPLRPSQEVKQPGFYAFATEMFVFLPKNQDPYVLLFSEENEPRLFAFHHPVDRLLKLCGWQDARGKGK